MQRFGKIDEASATLIGSDVDALYFEILRHVNRCIEMRAGMHRCNQHSYGMGKSRLDFAEVFDYMLVIVEQVILIRRIKGINRHTVPVALAEVIDASIRDQLM